MTVPMGGKFNWHQKKVFLRLLRPSDGEYSVIYDNLEFTKFVKVGVQSDDRWTHYFVVVPWWSSCCVMGSCMWLNMITPPVKSAHTSKNGMDKHHYPRPVNSKCTLSWQYDEQWYKVGSSITANVHSILGQKETILNEIIMLVLLHAKRYFKLIQWYYNHLFTQIRQYIYHTQVFTHDCPTTVSEDKETAHYKLCCSAADDRLVKYLLYGAESFLRN